VSELEEHRRALVGLGYRMLGTLADAEDVAQEALLRLHRADPPPDDARAWLVRVATRLCLDRLRALRARREAHVGEWLPDMLLTAPGADEQVDRAESLSLAFLVVLEALSPAERAAFLLHDVFAYSYDEVAEVLDRAPTACRQLVSRARRHVQEGRPRFEPDRARREAIAYAFMQAASEGDLDGLVALLAEDAELRADAAGRRPAPKKPVVGAAKVANFLLTVGRKTAAQATFELFDVNGTPGFVVRMDSELDSIYAHEVDADGRIAAVLAIRDPDRVRELYGRLRP
jgi:RNA polymerase sigma-70 factor, ECF subfamily